jgi:hypothetical protein
MEVVDAALYSGRGVKSSPMVSGEKSGEGERDVILSLIVV